MPHVTIKIYPGQSSEQKQNLSDAIVKSIVETTGKTEDVISIDFVEVDQDQWMEKVYDEEIKPNMDRLLKKPGY